VIPGVLERLEPFVASNQEDDDVVVMHSK
jgi:hypothetical protein